MNNKKKILIIDDDPASLASTKLILEGSYEVTATESPVEGLKLLDKQNYDLILLDIFIPEMDGMEVLKILRAKHSDIPVIVLSGSVEWVRRKGEVQQQGAVDYVLKPYDTKSLQIKIREILYK